MMISIAVSMVAALAVGIQVPVPPEPTPLTDVQREMLVSGMFEVDSFREPAFEALVENVKSWPEEILFKDVIGLTPMQPGTFAELCEREPGALAGLFGGKIRRIESLGDAFPGVNRVTVETWYGTPKNGARGTWLVFLVDEENQEVGSSINVEGRLYKLMQLQTQQSDALTAFPAIVGRSFDYTDPSDDEKPIPSSDIITALTGALAVVFFVVIMGRHMLSKNRPQRRPLASAGDPSDDHTDA